ncbi:threonine/serine exporter family protein [Glycomyces sp. NPDC046736]|uniref:threonine/serine ThrE exporter family protein n=1 Tax=Glycomyces sp. NPDC046736 TaxID=3155615 RepID=UPI0033EF1539
MGGRFQRWADRLAKQRLDHLEPPGPKGQPPPSWELIRFLRDLGVALSGSGAATGRIVATLRSLAEAYNAPGVDFFIFPTGVFVRIADPDGTLRTDFAATPSDPLRLYQIDALYRLIGEVAETRMAPAEGRRRLEVILKERPRHGLWTVAVGAMLLAIGLGLTRNPPWEALAGYAILGAVNGVLQMLATRFGVLSLALPVVAGAVSTVIAFSLPDSLTGGDPVRLLIPSLIIFLPGAALTIGAIELSTGSMVAGAARLMYAFNLLFLLAFGILVGTELVDVTYVDSTSSTLGAWSAWVGVAIVGVGYAINQHAPTRTLGWVLVVLYGVWIALNAGEAMGSALLGAFLAGLALTPLSYLAQSRPSGPPAQVTFLPAFWLIVPGVLGLTGVSELITGSTEAATGITDLVTALLTVVAIALGILVGSGFTQANDALSPARAIPPEPAAHPEPPPRTPEPS